MNALQRLDNWGRRALRNALASGPLDAPVASWTLAAPSEAELREWLAAFDQVSVRAPLLQHPASACAAAYAPIGARPVSARAPVLPTAEEDV